MRLPRVRFGVRGMMVAVTDTACVVSCAAHPAAAEASRRRRAGTMTGGGRARWRAALENLAGAIALIGLPGVASGAAYWCSCGGRWYVVPMHRPPSLAVGGGGGAAIALGVEVPLRRALWTEGLRRSSRLVSLSLAASALAALLTLGWLDPRRASYRELARIHGASAGHYGGAERAAPRPAAPSDGAKAT